MNDLLNKFGTMPKPVQAGALLASGGGIVGAVNLMGWQNAIAILIFGGALVGLLLLGYRQLLKWQASRKSNPMEQAIRGNAGAAPIGIAEPARRARLDDLRTNFESGIQKFRDAGKNIYSLPWYLLVGEPGSGKTEAIRHCNVGFPPGLQDQLQGAGGTLNMNWWFTNFAVILDTAGRLMFEEVAPGTTNEWQEFLKLLRRTRPNCPINGMLLVIPAESLIRDSAEAIERKGGKIAEQLDAIQRLLGVRFPVYVVVTKCDLINGFREFFDGIADPGLQHQIMGWSNPSPLDSPFNPEQVDEHLRTVKQRLTRRRLALLQDPVHTEDERARRTDQVDALYEFPEAFMDIAPRLKRYLQMVFVAGEWSAKPLFLRGIYFTSAMREGEALDAKLAAALSIPVESLPEGKVWDREKAYFLRDLFMGKVFKERGLVTRASNTSAHQRRRRNILYGVSAVGVLLLGGLSYFGLSNLRQSVGVPAAFWGGVVQSATKWRNEERPPATNTDQRPSVKGWMFPVLGFGSSQFEWRYADNHPDIFKNVLTDLPVFPASDARYGAFPLVLKAEAERTIGVPTVYVPIAALRGDRPGNMVEAPRREAARVLFHASVTRPLVDAVINQYQYEQGNRGSISTSAESVQALAQLIRLEVTHAVTAVSKDPKNVPPPLDPAPLMKYLLGEQGGAIGKDDLAKALTDLAEIQKVRDWLYPGTDRPTEAELPAPPSDQLAKWLTDIRNSEGDPNSEHNRVVALLSAIREYRTAEAKLQELTQKEYTDRTSADWSTEWGIRFAQLEKLGGKLESAMKVLEGRSLPTAYNATLAAQLKQQTALVDTVLAELKWSAELAAPAPKDGGAKPEDAKPAQKRIDQLAVQYAQVKSRREELIAKGTGAKQGDEAATPEIKLFQSAFIGEGAWKKRFDLYKAAATEIRLAGEITPGNAKPGEIGDGIKARLDSLARNRKATEESSSTVAGSEPEVQNILSGGKAVTIQAYRVATSLAASSLIRRLGDAVLYPNDGDKLAAAVARLAAVDQALEAPPRPRLPLTGSEDRFQADFSPKAAERYLLDYFAAANAVVSKGPPLLDPDRAPLAGAVSGAASSAKAYLAKFADYWSDDLFTVKGPFPTTANSWSAFQQALGGEVRYADLLNAAIDGLKDAAATAASIESATPELKDAAVSDTITRIRRWSDDSKRIRPEALADVTEKAGRWAKLGPDVLKARGKLLSDLRRRNCDPSDYYEAPPRTSDLALWYFHKLTAAGFAAMADDPNGNVNLIANDLRELFHFPLRKWSAGDFELNPVKVDLAREKLPLVEALAGSAGSSGCSFESAPTPIRKSLNTMFGGGGLNDADVAMIKEMSARAAALPRPDAPTKVKIYLTDPRRVDERKRITDQSSLQLRFGAGAGECAFFRPMAPGAEMLLGEAPFNSESISVALFAETNCNNAPVEVFPINTKWFPMYVLDLAGEPVPAAGGPLKATASVPLGGAGAADARYLMPVRIEAAK